MSTKQKFFESFIMGMGNTTAALVVCGALGGAFVLGQTIVAMWSTRRGQNTKDTQTGDDFNEFEDDGFRFKRVFENLVG